MTTLIELAYLVAAVCFILGLKQLSSPKGARNGNFIAAVGMVIALVATLPLLHFTTAGVVIIAMPSRRWSPSSTEWGAGPPPWWRSPSC